MRNINLTLKLAWFTLLSYRGFLPGRRFGTFGRRLALRLKFANLSARQLFFNPVSAVRYFEFDFAERCFPEGHGIVVLDVSSPALFGYYLSEHRELEYQYINLDEREFVLIKQQLTIVKSQGSYSTNTVDARKIPLPDHSCDVVLSISVIEHIPDEGDTQAVAEMWRVLRPGGRLILTFPIKTQYTEEFRDRDVYDIGISEQGSNYFFQRYYDEETIRSRLTNQLENYDIVQKALYGERVACFFHEYEQRWIENGLDETIKDPYLMSRHMKKYSTIKEMPGLGIIGLCLEKDRKQNG